MTEQPPKKDYVQELVDILARLRAPGGCPWDREQTHQSLKPYLAEEAAELLDAIDEENDEAMADELGDVLLQIVFHCQIAREEDRFDLQTAARKCCEKMVRRHPHVFGETSVKDAAGVVDQWEKIKKTEKAGAKRKSAVSGVPRSLSALSRANKLQKKAAKVGFDWPSIDGALAKVEEELAELREALRSNDDEAIGEEIGDLLFSVVNVSRFRKRCPEDLLHRTVKKFENRFMHMEKAVQADDKDLQDCSLDEMEAAWQAAKKHDKKQK